MKKLLFVLLLMFVVSAPLAAQKAEDCGCEDKPLPEVLGVPSFNPADRATVLAIVNDKQITNADIENSLRPLIFNIQEEVYALRKQDLELKVNDTLLSQEAQKKGVTTRALLDTEVSAKVPRVSDAQAQAFYDQNKDRISGEFAQVKAQIIQYLQESKDQEATLAFAQQLRRAATVQINLTAPVSPVFSIALASTRRSTAAGSRRRFNATS
jgi:hypothetical protein